MADNVKALFGAALPGEPVPEIVAVAGLHWAVGRLAAAEDEG